MSKIPAIGDKVVFSDGDQAAESVLSEGWTITPHTTHIATEPAVLCGKLFMAWVNYGALMYGSIHRVNEPPFLYGKWSEEHKVWLCRVEGAFDRGTIP